MTDDLNPESTQPESERPEGALAPEAAATDETAAPEASATEEAPAPPREVIKGLHPELRCQDPECAPEYTELQFFSPEEAIKTKGRIMLFCARSGKKYFSPAPELQAWLAERKVKTGRGRRQEG